MNSPKITVVIPMYNCEQYVDGVLSMFAEQSFGDFEVVCVIDGATDNTKELVEAFCKTDDRFRFLVQENAGAGAARNTGLDYATGEYIIWADADDAYSKDYLKSLYEAGEKHRAEIVMCLFSTTDYLTNIKFRSGFNLSVFEVGKVYAHNEINNLLSSVASRVTNKLYRRDFIINNGIRFSESIISNDIFFNAATLLSASRIATVRQDLLEYRLNVNQESLTSKRGRNLIVVLDELEKIYRWMDEHDKIKDHLADYMTIFNNSVSYSCGFEMDESFLQGVARILNTEEPWCKMSSEEICSYAGEIVFASNAKEKLNKAEKEKSQFATEKERKARSQINSAAYIRKVSFEQYRRDFNDPNSMPR